MMIEEDVADFFLRLYESPYWAFVHKYVQSTLEHQTLWREVKQKNLVALYIIFIDKFKTTLFLFGVIFQGKHIFFKFQFKKFLIVRIKQDSALDSAPTVGKDKISFYINYFHYNVKWTNINS